MRRFSKLMLIPVPVLFFVASGCSPLARWTSPQVWLKPGQVAEVRQRIAVPVVIRENGKLKRAHYIAEVGNLVGPPPPASEVR